MVYRKRILRYANRHIAPGNPVSYRQSGAKYRQGFPDWGGPSRRYSGHRVRIGNAVLRPSMLRSLIRGQFAGNASGVPLPPQNALLAQLAALSGRIG